jgi:glutamine amidotransferase
VPVLGICLGMQLMCNASEEGTLPGLGWVDADVRRFKFEQDSSLKIPHMGWNSVSVAKKDSIICSDQEDQRFYFVHSYHVICNHAKDTLAIAHHGYEFTAAFSHENIYGVQFHPEKSHKFGMALMKKFVEL